MKIAEGNPGRRPLNDAEPEPDVAEPDCPACLKGEAKREWQRIVPQLLALGLLAQIDRAALAAYCQAWAEFCECTEVLNKEGRVIREPIIMKIIGEKGVQEEVAGHRLKKHPIVSMQRDALARIKSFIGEFGLSPSSRSNLKVEKPEPEDELASFMNRKRG